MIHPIESVKLIQRIVQLAQDEEPVIASAKAEETARDRFEPPKATPAAKPQPAKHNWAHVLWDFRKNLILESRFIENVANPIRKTIAAIEQLPDFYRKDDLLKSSQHKKESIRNILQSIIDYLEETQNKTIGSLAWSVLKGALDLDHIFKRLSDPIIQLLLELKSEDLPEKHLKDEAVQNLASFFKAIPYAIPTYKEINQYKKQSNCSLKSNEDLVYLYYYEHLDLALQRLSQSLKDIGFSENTVTALTSVFIQPQATISTVIPKTMLSIGHGIEEPFNQILIAHILELAASLAPICAPKRENLFPICSSPAQAAIEKIAKEAPSLHHFLEHLKSDFKQRKIQENLEDIKKILPPIFESLKKSPLGLSPSEGGQAMLLGEFKNQERSLGHKYEHAFQKEAGKHRVHTFFSKLYSWVFKKTHPISCFKKWLEQLKTNLINVFNFYNKLSALESPSWLRNLRTQIQNELSVDDGYVDQHAKSLLEIGNKNIFMIAQDHASNPISRYKIWNDDFNKSFWDSITGVDTKLLQKWINSYLRINHFSHYELLLTTKSDSISELDWLAIKIAKHNQKLEKLKTLISHIDQHNSREIHALVARITNTEQREIPDSIQTSMQKKSLALEELQKEEFTFSKTDSVMVENYLQKELLQLKKNLLEDTMWHELTTSRCFGFTKNFKEKCKQIVSEIITQNASLSMLQQFKLCSQLLESIKLLNDDTCNSIYKYFKGITRFN